jgi:hypothetical protein
LSATGSLAKSAPVPSSELAELRVQRNAQFAELLSKIKGLTERRPGQPGSIPPTSRRATWQRRSFRRRWLTAHRSGLIGNPAQGSGSKQLNQSRPVYGLLLVASSLLMALRKTPSLRKN